jgi:hypothetical protein
MERTKHNENDLIKSLVLQTLKSDAYLPVNKALMQNTGLIEAVIISNYIDKHIYFEKQHPENDGWFFLTHQQQMEQLNIGDFSIRKAKTFLIDNHIIQTKKQGTPAKEWIKLNFNKISELLYKKVPTNKNVEINELDPPKTTNYNNNKYKENKNISFSKEKEYCPQFVSSKENNNKYLPLSAQLAKTITTHKNIKITPSKIEFWAKDIRKLIEADGVDSPRVKKTLDWYENHIGEQYIPVIESGKSLREKFIRLENAMENNGYSNSGFVPKSKPKYAAARTSKLKSIPDIIINNTTNEWKKTI